MATHDIFSIKIYLEYDSDKTEVRRLSLPKRSMYFLSFSEEIKNFDNLRDKTFNIYWKDEDDDKVIVSSDQDLFIALREMRSDVKKFYITVKNSSSDNHKEANTGVLHPMVHCDGCNKKISGFRYKCLFCKNYDLCHNCEKACLHAEHPMLRLPNPDLFDRAALNKLVKNVSSLPSQKFNDENHCSHHSRKKYSSDNMNSINHKKNEKYEAGLGAAVSEAEFKKRLRHGKWKKINCSICKCLMDDYLTYLDPIFFQNLSQSKQESGENSTKDFHESPYFKYLKNIGKTIATLLDPLGIDVNIDVQPAAKNEEKEKNIESDSKREPSCPEGNNFFQEKVHFDSQKDTINSVQAKVEKVVHLDSQQDLTNPVQEKVKKATEDLSLSDLKMSESSEMHNWVFYEELQADLNKASEIPKSSSNSSENGQIINDIKSSFEPTVFGENQNQALYPSLNHPRVLKDEIQQALSKMLAMGFTNEGGWLTQLLEAKNGDINEALEVLDVFKEKQRFNSS